MDNFIDNNEIYHLFAEGKMCLQCYHPAHRGNSCYTEDDECDCFECQCPQCKAKSNES